MGRTIFFTHSNHFAELWVFYCWIARIALASFASNRILRRLQLTYKANNKCWVCCLWMKMCQLRWLYTASAYCVGYNVHECCSVLRLLLICCLQYLERNDGYSKSYFFVLVREYYKFCLQLWKQWCERLILTLGQVVILCCSSSRSIWYFCSNQSM